jgi:CRISPR-associated protein (TIGR02710 family)
MSDPHSSAPPVTAALVSVGGSPAPVLFTLRQHKPKHVWYFCSGGSRGNAEEIQEQLDWHPAHDFIEVERYEELGPCYRKLRERIPELLAKWKVPAAEVLADYTGGTKTMSAALVMASLERFGQFSYIGGEQREKAGLGVTVDGRERVLYQENPWSQLAVREVERARDLWRGCQFEAAEEVLREVAGRVSGKMRFESLANLAGAMAARHRLDFKTAKNRLGPLRGALPLLYDGRGDFGVVDFVAKAMEVCNACSKGEASPELLRELLDNTLRTAAQRRYEDAAARLYRAMEMQGQIWLADATDGAFRNGRCGSPEKIPEKIASLDFCKPDGGGDVKFSLEQVFRALAATGHAQAGRIAADLDAGDSKGGTKSRWRIATEKRNSGILAHGTQSIGNEGFESMKEIATDLLGFDLENQANPIPPLDPRWC